jgi:hypothetical protein
LPPETFTTSAHSDEWKIANALSAGPASITEHAAVLDWPTNLKDGMSHGRVLRPGTNGWTCMPDIPFYVGPHVMVVLPDSARVALRDVNQDLSNNQPYTSRLSSAATATPLWVIPVAKGGDVIEERPGNQGPGNSECSLSKTENGPYGARAMSHRGG